MTFGSSPLARGTQHDLRAGEEGRRFIPAGAGNTPASWSSASLWPVHPRWRGEHFKNRGTSNDPNGSSPLARGTQASPPWTHPLRRFIPAGAGNTAGIHDRQCHHPVHPRWRGEHYLKPRYGTPKAGSSPLARRTRRRKNVLPAEFRFIPAGAGNTHGPICQPIKVAVHPRWRGEHDEIRRQLAGNGGSSPLARGTLHRRHQGCGI